MQTYFYNLAGGINQSASKTALGLDTKQLYWSDSKNIEPLQNNGLIRQNGNKKIINLEQNEKIISIYPIKENSEQNIFIATELGNLYIYTSKNQSITKLNKTIKGTCRINCIEFLNGFVVGSNVDEIFYVNKGSYIIESCNLKDSTGTDLKADTIGVFAGRLWVAHNATLYYSALGKYNDFTTANDAGYINNFYTDTEEITALKPYKDYLAIYKENSVYLLSGSNNSDFKIVPFADKGTSSFSAVINVNNKQYFVNKGIFSLEQAGLLSQIQLGEEISINIKTEFEKFDSNRFNEIIVIHYERKNQIWFFIPYQNKEFLNSVWIFDYVTSAWFKREVPQNITSACFCNDSILSADSIGNIYIEDFGDTFDNQPIEFMWKSPFLAAGDSNIKKTIEEFYFILDDSCDNNFNFSVCKDFDETYEDDEDKINSINTNNLVWYGENLSSNLNFYWDCDTKNSINSLWATGANSIQKAEISESNYSVQLCIKGSQIDQNMAIIGLEFKEILLDE